MALYAVDLQGEYFPMREQGRWKLYGFDTELVVEADTPEEAELMAVRMVHMDPVWGNIRPRPGFPTPRIYPEGVYECEEEPTDLPEYELFRMRK